MIASRARGSMEPDSSSADQFYSGLVAELYDPLASEPTRAEDYAPFLNASGTPALELACGSGSPLLDLLEQGYEVEGLDSSNDMLSLCRARALERGLEPTLHRGLMQSFSLARRYRSIFIAGASFTLLTNDEDARSALTHIAHHLEPGGNALIPIEIPDLDEVGRAIGHVRQLEDASGARLSVSVTAVERAADEQGASIRLRYERVPVAGEPEVVEREWQRRWWTQDRLGALATETGFARVSFVKPGGGADEPGDRVFVMLGHKA